MNDPAVNPPLVGPGRRPGWRFLLAHPAHLVALGFGSGLSPVAPGTAGTLWAWFVYVALQPEIGDLGRAVVLVVSTLVGWWACTVTARDLAQADPSAVVWDEVVAFWLVLWLVTPASFTAQAVAFVLFRFFDAAKPGPVAWAGAVHAHRHRGVEVRVSADPEVDALVARVAEALRARAATMATAESCTGGLVAAACTSLAGSSDWFERGVVTYSNAAKTELLGVPGATIGRYGAVSAEVARAMATGALAHSPAAFAVAITGIAGPGGGSIDKPVGTVWLATTARDGAAQATLLNATGDRDAVRRSSVVHALELLLARIASTPERPG
jgi:phosphatidylglycerophosphatase A